MPASKFGCGNPECKDCYEDLSCRRCHKPDIQPVIEVLETDNAYECSECEALMIFSPEESDLGEPMLISAGTVYKMYPMGRSQYLELDDV